MTPNHQSDYSLSLPFKAMPSMMARVKFSLVAGFILMGIPNLPLWKHSFNELGGFAAIIHPQWIEFYVACIVGFGFFYVCVIHCTHGNLKRRPSYSSQKPKPH